MNLHFFHANFTTTIYGQNLHLIPARSRDVIEHNFFNDHLIRTHCGMQSIWDFCYERFNVPCEVLCLYLNVLCLCDSSLFYLYLICMFLT